MNQSHPPVSPSVHSDKEAAQPTSVNSDMEFGHVFPLHWAGWAVATLPVHTIIEVKTLDEKNDVTEKWKEATLSTLTSVIYIVRSILSPCLPRIRRIERRPQSIV